MEELSKVLWLCAAGSKNEFTSFWIVQIWETRSTNIIPCIGLQIGRHVSNISVVQLQTYDRTLTLWDLMATSSAPEHRLHLKAGFPSSS